MCPRKLRINSAPRSPACSSSKRSRVAAFPARTAGFPHGFPARSEEHTSELQSLMRISYAVFCLKKQNKHTKQLIDRRLIIETRHDSTVYDEPQSYNRHLLQIK